jgi:hypothetical protein
MTKAVLSNLFYVLRLVIFLLRWQLFAAYGLVNFFSKRAARLLIVPALAASATYLCRLPLDLAIQTYVLDVNWWRQLPEPLTVEVLAASGVAVAVCVYAMLPRHVEGQPPSVAFGLLGFLARLSVLVTVAGLAAHYYGYHPPPEFMAYLPDWHLTLADAVLVFVLIAAAFVYAVASCVLELVLGAFPPMVRPLRPMRALRVRNRKIRPVAVRLAVPKLPRRRRTLRVATLLPGVVK